MKSALEWITALEHSPGGTTLDPRECEELIPLLRDAARYRLLRTHENLGYVGDCYSEDELDKFCDEQIASGYTPPVDDDLE